jgi:hypothetical protein
MDQLWEIEADAIMNKNKCSAEMVRTFVILRWMHLKGDLRPLADAILKGHEMDKAVLNALRLMILDDDAVPASLKDRTPYRLESKRRFGKPGRPKQPENFVRDLVIRTHELISGSKNSGLAPTTLRSKTLPRGRVTANE